MPKQDDKHTRGLGSRAEEGAGLPSGKSWFLGIGVNTYQHFPRLNNARKDVEDLLHLLQGRYRLDEGITLLDEAATRQAVIDQLYALQGLLKENDKLIIFYSGHGHLDGKGRGYWIPADATPNQVSSYIPSSTIQYLVEDIGCRHILLVSDSCFSGALLTRSLGYAQQALEELERDRSRWVISSGRQREEVADGKPGENSPFTASILRVLRENQQPRLNVGLLFDQVTKLTRFNYKQMPQSAPFFGAGHEGGQYVFHLKANEAADWKDCQEAGTAAAYRVFLAKYPDGMYVQAARATLAELEEEAAWAEAGKKSTVASYNAYLDHYPAGPHAEEAFQRIKQLEDDARWSEASRIDQVYAYRDYLRRFPDGSHSAEARERIRKLEQPVYSAAANPSPAEIKETAVPPPAKPADEGGSPPAPFPWRRNLLAGLGLAAVLLLGIWVVRQLTKGPQAVNEAPSRLELFSANGKYGYRDQSGKEIIAAIYDSAGIFQDGRAEAALDGQTFTIDSTGACVAGCPEEKDKTAWAEAERLNNIEAYKSYRQAFPKGQFYEEAGKRIKVFEARLQQDEAAQQDQQAWEAARKKDDMAAYENYQKSYPSGQYYQQAQKRIDALKSQQRQAEAVRKEERAWQDAKSKNTIAAYQSYQAAYPGGKYYGEAGKKIRALEDAAKQPAVRAVRLNGLNWTAQNLNIDVPDSWCYKGDPANCQKYGRLYSWAAAKKACAALGAGWRLPTDEEWKSLANAYGGYYDWGTIKDVGNPKRAYSALIEGGSDSNRSGFSALLGGWRNTDGSFKDLGDDGHYWSATEGSSGYAWKYYFGRSDGKLRRLYNYNDMGLGFSCRCVQD